MDSNASTKIQSIILIVVLITAAGGGITYILLSEEEQSAETIKIGICADLDMLLGRGTYRGAILAAEQINKQGGLIGKNIEIIAEDSDGNSPGQDIKTGTTALIKLLTYHEVDFVISSDGGFLLTYQDIVSEHKRILFGIGSISNELTQRVEDNYDKYKYFFRSFPNATHALLGSGDCVDTLRDYSGFNKVAILVEDITTITAFVPILEDFLAETHGFEIVYQNKFPTGTIDFSSYLAAIESSEAQILYTWITSNDGIILVNEWYNRQSPFVLWGVNAYVGEPDAWDVTEGKCEHTTSTGAATYVGYPFTNETIPFRESYLERWGEIPNGPATYAYDVLRFILPDAIERADTIETEAVIGALEDTKVETTVARNFIYTSSHDTLGGETINNPAEDLLIVMLFQWQDGQQIPVYPKAIMEEAGATYTFPDWPGPWD